MDMIIEQLNGASERWFATMQLIAWQAVVVFAFARFATMLLRRYGPAITFWIWTASAAKIASQLVVPMVLAIPFWQVSNASHSTVVAKRMDLPTSVTITQPVRDIIPQSPSLTGRAVLFVIWAAIVLLQLILIVMRRRALSQMLRWIRPASATDRARLDALRSRLDVRFPVSLGRADVGSPFVTGIIRPRIVLPLDLKTTNSPTELDHVLLHELAHIKRRDLLWAWIPEITRIILFFHPIVYWISQEAKLQREAACDQAVVLSAGGTREYAQTLLAFSKRTRGLGDSNKHKLDLAIAGSE